MHLAFLLGITKVHILQGVGILFTPLLAENEIDDWQQLVFLEMIDEMCPDILVELEATRRRPKATASTAHRTGWWACRCTIDATASIRM